MLQKPFRDKRALQMLLLLFLTALFAAVYFTVPILLHFIYLPVIYLVLGGGFLIAFVIYNRGFALRNAKPEDLSDAIPLEEREARVAEAKRRFERSRWMLMIVIPVLMTFLFDLLYLFLGQTVMGWFR